jgi:hypothetical protein
LSVKKRSIKKRSIKKRSVKKRSVKKQIGGDDNDWYTVENISAVGFFADPLKIKFKQKSLGDKYGVYYLIDDQEEDASNDRIFVYDKSTLSHDKMELPGPYESRSTDHETKVIKNQKVNKCYKSEISNMKNKFGRECGYMTVMTTFDVSTYHGLFSDV